MSSSLPSVRALAVATVAGLAWWQADPQPVLAVVLAGAGVDTVAVLAMRDHHDTGTNVRGRRGGLPDDPDRPDGGTRPDPAPRGPLPPVVDGPRQPTPPAPALVDDLFARWEHDLARTTTPGGLAGTRP